MSCRPIDGNKAAGEDTLYELEYELVDRWFGSGRYCRIGTIGDGSCFFHSVCKATNRPDASGRGYNEQNEAGRKKIALALRTELSENLTKKAYNEIMETLVGSSNKSYEEIKSMLLKPATWAEEIMIKWTAKYLKHNIVFLNVGNNENNMYCGVHDSSTLNAVDACKKPRIPTVIVAWVDHEHFELVGRIDEINEGSHAMVKACFWPEDPTDLGTITSLMTSYASACRLKK